MLGSSGHMRPGMVSIRMRPPEVEDRVMPGHWESDLIRGADNKSAVGMLVERTTRPVVPAKMADATAASALQSFSDTINSIAEPMPQTLTYDQGREMALLSSTAPSASVMTAYLKSCRRAHDQGIDFTECNRHAASALPMEAFEVDYLVEKFDCIFGGRITASSPT